MTAILVCPSCRGDLTERGAAFRCARCRRDYPLNDGVPHFDPPTSASANDKDSRREYWDKGWESRYQNDHAQLAALQTRADWEAYLAAQIAAMPTYVRHVEAGRDVVNGKVSLDIGCGGGISSATFGYFGAFYIGVDHSGHAARYALSHLRAVGGDGFTLQGNAECLPIRDDSIDVVYSNGVLHHTPNFITALDEAYRVLKPGGRAVIALYATYSTLFGAIRAIGAVKGNLSRRAMDRWMGEQTEGAWRTGARLNPWTETFSAAKLRRIVREYGVKDLRFRKNGDPIEEIPRYGRRLMKYRAMRTANRALEPILGSMLIMSFTK